MTKDKQQLLERLKATRAGREVSTARHGGLVYIENDQRILINPDGPKAAEAIQSLLVENERQLAVIVEAAIPLEALQLCIDIDPTFPLAPTSRAEIANAVRCIRTLLGDS